MTPRHTFGMKPPIIRLCQYRAQVIISDIRGADQQLPIAGKRVVHDLRFAFAQVVRDPSDYLPGSFLKKPSSSSVFNIDVSWALAGFSDKHIVKAINHEMMRTFIIRFSRSGLVTRA
jgi:hypothetical protein